MLKLEEAMLREVKEADLRLILEWRNSYRIRSMMYTDQVIPWEEHYAWFQRTKAADTSKHLIFEYSGIPSGVINFTQIDKKNGTAYWGFYIGPSDMPRGIGTILGFLGLSYAFESLNFRKLCAQVFAFNQASVAFHRKLGFSEEGILKSHVRKLDQYEDVYCFAMFQQDWPNQKQHLKAVIQGREIT